MTLMKKLSSKKKLISTSKKCLPLNFNSETRTTEFSCTSNWKCIMQFKQFLSDFAGAS